MNTAVYTTTIASPWGPVCLAGTVEGLTRVDFQHGERPVDATPHSLALPAYFDQAAKQLSEYFAGTRKQFNLPLTPPGTDFQHLVWQTLQQVSYGTTVTYQELAERLGKPTAARAVGSANGRNPIAIIVP